MMKKPKQESLDISHNHFLFWFNSNLIIISGNYLLVNIHHHHNVSNVQNNTVPHAGTSAGDNALKHAIFTAKASKARILILHVIEDVPRAPLTFALHSSQIDTIKKQIREATEEMKEVMEKEMQKRVKLCSNKNIKTDLKITIGLPAQEIVRILNNQRIDLIVMAKRRKLPGIKSILTLGSVSRKIVEKASCPVLLVDVE